MSEQTETPWLTLDPAQVVDAGSSWQVQAQVAEGTASYAWAVTRLSTTGTAQVTTGLTGTSAPTLSGAGSTTTAGTVLVVQCTATAAGQTATATTEVRVPSTGPVTVLAGDGTGDPGWAVVGGAASTGAALGDDDPDTKVASPEVEPGGSTTRTWRLAPTTPKVDAELVAGQVTPTVPSGATVTVALVHGTTVLASQSSTPATAQDVVLTIADAATTVGDDPASWSALSVQVTVQVD